MAGPTCIFCRIAKGEVPSAKVHEDADTFAFLDIQPLREGHVLVIPKAHRQHVQDLTAAEHDALWRAVRALVPRIERAVGATGTTIGVNNGRASGQEVPHVHVHVVPRRDGDGGGPVHAAFPDRPTVAKERFPDLAKRMREA